MLRAILNKSWRQHPTKLQLYGYQPPVTKTIQIRRTRHAGHSWRSRDELVSDVLQWTPSQGRAKAGRPARTYIRLLCADTGCILEDLLKAMDDKERWRERVRNICADSVTWIWWWYKFKVFQEIWYYFRWTDCFRNIFISFRNLITWPLRILCLIFKYFYFPIQLHIYTRKKKKKDDILNIEFCVALAPAVRISDYSNANWSRLGNVINFS